MFKWLNRRSFQTKKHQTDHLVALVWRVPPLPTIHPGPATEGLKSWMDEDWSQHVTSFIVENWKIHNFPGTSNSVLSTLHNVTTRIFVTSWYHNLTSAKWPRSCIKASACLVKPNFRASRAPLRKIFLACEAQWDEKNDSAKRKNQWNIDTSGFQAWIKIWIKIWKDFEFWKKLWNINFKENFGKFWKRSAQLFFGFWRWKLFTRSLPRRLMSSWPPWPISAWHWDSYRRRRVAELLGDANMASWRHEDIKKSSSNSTKRLWFTFLWFFQAQKNIFFPENGYDSWYTVGKINESSQSCCDQDLPCSWDAFPQVALRNLRTHLAARALPQRVAMMCNQWMHYITWTHTHTHKQSTLTTYSIRLVELAIAS